MFASLTCTLAAMVLQTKPEEQYFGIYASGNKIGYAVYTFGPEVSDGRQVMKGSLLTNITAKAFKSRSSFVFYVTPTGSPIKATMDKDFGGERELCVAEFSPDSVTVSHTVGGKVKVAKGKLPVDGKVVLDPIFSSEFDKVSVRSLASTKVYTIDNWDKPSFLAATFDYKGETTISASGRNVSADWMKLHYDQGAHPDVTTTALNQAGDYYIGKDGKVVKETPYPSFDMVSEPRATALSGERNDLTLGDLHNVKAVGNVPTPRFLTQMTLQISADDKLDGIPSNDHQSAKKTSTGWTLEIHPPHLGDTAGATIAQVAALQPDSVKPDSMVLSASPNIVAQARRIVGKETDVLKAALKIQQFVAKYIRYDELFSDVQTSDEVFKGRRGVCRHFAVLDAALMRAAGIPARLAAGMIVGTNAAGEFGTLYDHMWVEVYDGTRWVGLETTSHDNAQVTAAYIEFVTGSWDQLLESPDPQAHHGVFTIVSVD